MRLRHDSKCCFTLTTHLLLVSAGRLLDHVAAARGGRDASDVRVTSWSRIVSNGADPSFEGYPYVSHTDYLPQREGSGAAALVTARSSKRPALRGPFPFPATEQTLGGAGRGPQTFPGPIARRFQRRSPSRRTSLPSVTSAGAGSRNEKTACVVCGLGTAPSIASPTRPARAAASSARASSSSRR